MGGAGAGGAAVGFEQFADQRTGCPLAFDRLGQKGRLVESHELVKEYGSIVRAKMYAESTYTAPEVVDRLKQAIADVESCQ